MTTVVYKNGVLAADKLVKRNNSETGIRDVIYRQKVHTPENMLLNGEKVLCYAFAGLINSATHPYLNKLNTQTTPIDIVHELSVLANASMASIVDVVEWVFVTQWGPTDVRCQIVHFTRYDPSVTRYTFPEIVCQLATTETVVVGAGSSYVMAADAIYEDLSAPDLIKVASTMCTGTSFDVDYVNTNAFPIQVTKSPNSSPATAPSDADVLAYVNALKRRDVPLRRDLNDIRPKPNERLYAAFKEKIWGLQG